jgi:type II secretion system protein G
MFKRNQKGFTLIELLIVVAIIGIIAAILIPNFLDALHKGRQKRTMGDMKELGTALASRYTDVGGAAAAGQVTISWADWTGEDNAETDRATIEEALVPEYIQQVPDTDGWGNDLEYSFVLNNPPRIRYAGIRSTGRDGDFDGDTYTVGQFDPTDYDQDIVFTDGGFSRAPRSAQAQT